MNVPGVLGLTRGRPHKKGRVFVHDLDRVDGEGHHEQRDKEEDVPEERQPAAAFEARVPQDIPIPVAEQGSEEDEQVEQSHADADARRQYAPLLVATLKRPSDKRNLRPILLPLSAALLLVALLLLLLVALLLLVFACAMM